MKHTVKRKLNLPVLAALALTMGVVVSVTLVGWFVCRAEPANIAVHQGETDQTKSTDHLSSNLAAILEKVSDSTTDKKEYSLFKNTLAELVSEYGSFDPDQHGTMRSFSDTWFDPRGVLGAEIQDLDLDGADEMAVCIAVPDETSATDAYSVVLNVYEVENNCVEQSATAVVGAYIEPNPGEKDQKKVVLTPNFWQNQIVAVNLIQKDGQYYFFCEDYSTAGAFADGLECSYWMMQYRDHSIQYVCSYTQTEGGSVEFAYTGYRFENGNCVSATLYYSENYEDSAPYDQFGEAMTAFFCDYGVQMNDEVQHSERVSDKGHQIESVLSDQNDSTLLFQLINREVCFVAKDAIWSEYSYDFAAKLLRGNSLLDDMSGSNSEQMESTGPLYEGNIMSVSGTLVEKDYEINSQNKGTVYILKLDTPIMKSLYSDYLEYNGEETEISEIQIGFEDQKDEQRYLNQDIMVTGNVMFGTTGHHLTTVLLMDAYVFA